MGCCTYTYLVMKFIIVLFVFFFKSSRHCRRLHRYHVRAASFLLLKRSVLLANEVGGSPTEVVVVGSSVATA